MTRYFIMRFVILIPTLLAVLFVTFMLGSMGPIDPVVRIRERLAGQQIYLDEEELAALRHSYGLDRPLLVQFWTYVDNLLHGNLGISYVDSAPIWPRIQKSLPVSGSLAVGAFLILIFVGIPLGTLAARFHNTRVDYSVVGLTLFLQAVPVYVLIPITLIILVLWLGVMNVPRGWKGVWHPSYFLGCALISVRTLAGVVRQTRGGILEVMGNDYVRTARAKGLREFKVVTRHVMRNSLIPVVTTLGMLIDDFMWGAVFLDVAFNFPGLGRVYSMGLGSRDYNIIFGVTIFTAMLTMGFNLLVDVLYPILDPRVAFG